MSRIAFVKIPDLMPPPDACIQTLTSMEIVDSPGLIYFRRLAMIEIDILSHVQRQLISRGLSM